jgi:hypothetical protein
MFLVLETSRHNAETLRASPSPRHHFVLIHIVKGSGIICYWLQGDIGFPVCLGKSCLDFSRRVDDVNASDVSSWKYICYSFYLHMHIACVISVSILNNAHIFCLSIPK